ncbi:DUF1707 SHOCT-like domain-containing protein [Paractinoplanes globisporus]|uniref:DUF1707 domain-containing protein n=1 Tax=Paractinoplanes globisporus TaxID=113565 RepID=A0ABW6WW25_9ACTN|nr:DUF1707 domain-containing protein [Actinoplanes globisporus]
MRDRRVGAAERTQVLGLLGNAFEAGLLPVGDYDARVAAVGVATHASQLLLQVSDLPPAYAWSSVARPTAEPTPGAGRIALILGIASVPMAVCGIGLVLGLLAVVASRNAGRGVTTALVGRVFGIIGMALSVAALVAAFLAWHGTSNSG